MSASLSPVQIATASKYLKGATDVTLRNRPVFGWLDKAGRINRNATGKDMNWLIKYKDDEARPYTQFQDLSFANTNYHVAAAVTPERWFTTSGMDISEKKENSGETAIVDTFMDRVNELAKAMEIFLAKSFYSDANAASGTGRPIGIGTVAKGSTTIACTNADRLRAPVATTSLYAGLSIALGNLGGTWSSNITSAQRMSTTLGSDWPDGQGDPTNAYDGTSPRLYNENTSRWADPSASAANSTWRTNCISMLSRANTDLRMNSVEEMMPNLHLSGSQRHQDVKDKLREAYRDIAAHTASVNLGYHTALDFEGAAIVLDHECPANKTYSVNAQSIDYQFYGVDEGGAPNTGDGEGVTGGIYEVFGPTRPAHLLQWVWIMYASGNSRISPKWVVCHSDWTY